MRYEKVVRSIFLPTWQPLTPEPPPWPMNITRVVFYGYSFVGGKLVAPDCQDLKVLLSDPTNSVVAKVINLAVQHDILTKKGIYLLPGGGGEQRERGLAGGELGKHC